MYVARASTPRTVISGSRSRRRAWRRSVRVRRRDGGAGSDGVVGGETATGGSGDATGAGGAGIVMAFSQLAAGWKIFDDPSWIPAGVGTTTERKSTRLKSSHPHISYAVFFFKKKK